MGEIDDSVEKPEDQSHTKPEESDTESGNALSAEVNGDGKIETPDAAQVEAATGDRMRDEVRSETGGDNVFMSGGSSQAIDLHTRDKERTVQETGTHLPSDGETYNEQAAAEPAPDRVVTTEPEAAAQPISLVTAPEAEPAGYSSEPIVRERNDQPQPTSSDFQSATIEKPAGTETPKAPFSATSDQPVPIVTEERAEPEADKPRLENPLYRAELEEQFRGMTDEDLQRQQQEKLKEGSRLNQQAKEYFENQLKERGNLGQDDQVLQETNRLRAQAQERLSAAKQAQDEYQRREIQRTGGEYASLPERDANPSSDSTSYASDEPIVRTPDFWETHGIERQDEFWKYYASNETVRDRARGTSQPTPSEQPADQPSADELAKTLEPGLRQTYESMSAGKSEEEKRKIYDLNRGMQERSQKENTLEQPERVETIPTDEDPFRLKEIPTIPEIEQPQMVKRSSRPADEGGEIRPADGKPLFRPEDTDGKPNEYTLIGPKAREAFERESRRETPAQSETRPVERTSIRRNTLPGSQQANEESAKREREVRPSDTSGKEQIVKPVDTGATTTGDKTNVKFPGSAEAQAAGNKLPQPTAGGQERLHPRDANSGTHTAAEVKTAEGHTAKVQPEQRPEEARNYNREQEAFNRDANNGGRPVDSGRTRPPETAEKHGQPETRNEGITRPELKKYVQDSDRAQSGQPRELAEKPGEDGSPEQTHPRGYVEQKDSRTKDTQPRSETPARLTEKTTAGAPEQRARDTSHAGDQVRSLESLRTAGAQKPGDLLTERQVRERGAKLREIEPTIPQSQAERIAAGMSPQERRNFDQAHRRFKEDPNMDNRLGAQKAINESLRRRGDESSEQFKTRQKSTEQGPQAEQRSGKATEKSTPTESSSRKTTDAKSASPEASKQSDRMNRTESQTKGSSDQSSARGRTESISRAAGAKDSPQSGRPEAGPGKVADGKSGIGTSRGTELGAKTGSEAGAKGGGNKGDTGVPIIAPPGELPVSGGKQGLSDLLGEGKGTKKSGDKNVQGKGDKGAAGARGERGVRGPRGAEGAKSAEGPAGPEGRREGITRAAKPEGKTGRPDVPAGKPAPGEPRGEGGRTQRDPLGLRGDKGADVPIIAPPGMKPFDPMDLVNRADKKGDKKTPKGDRSGKGPKGKGDKAPGKGQGRSDKLTDRAQGKPEKSTVRTGDKTGSPSDKSANKPTDARPTAGNKPGDKSGTPQEGGIPAIMPPGLPGMDLPIPKGKKGEKTDKPGKTKGDKATTKPGRVTEAGPRTTERGDRMIRGNRRPGDARPVKLPGLKPTDLVIFGPIKREVRLPVGLRTDAGQKSLQGDKIAARKPGDSSTTSDASTARVLRITGLKLPPARKIERSDSGATSGRDRSVAKSGDFTSALAKEFRSRTAETGIKTGRDKAGKPAAAEKSSAIPQLRPGDAKSTGTRIGGFKFDIQKPAGADRSSVRGMDFRADLAKEYRSRIPESLGKKGLDITARTSFLKADSLINPLKDSSFKPADRTAKSKPEPGRPSDRQLSRQSARQNDLRLTAREMRVAGRDSASLHRIIKALRTEIARRAIRDGTARPADKILPVTARTLDAILKAPGFKPDLTISVRDRAPARAKEIARPDKVKLPDLRLTTDKGIHLQRIPTRLSKFDQTALLKGLLMDRPVGRNLNRSLDRAQLTRPTSFLKPGRASDISWLRVGRAIKDANARLSVQGTSARLSLRDIALRMPSEARLQAIKQTGKAPLSLKLTVPTREIARKILSMRSETELLEELRRAGMVVEDKKKKAEIFITHFDARMRSLRLLEREEEKIAEKDKSAADSYLEALEFTDILGGNEALEAMSEADSEDEGSLSQGRQTYVVQKDDTLESIALKTLGDSILALLIMQINKNKIHSTMEDGRIVLNLEPGMTLYLPTMDEVQEFRMRLASGGMSIFQYSADKQKQTPEEELKDWQRSLGFHRSED